MTPTERYPSVSIDTYLQIGVAGEPIRWHGRGTITTTWSRMMLSAMSPLIVARCLLLCHDGVFPDDGVSLTALGKKSTGKTQDRVK